MVYWIHAAAVRRPDRVAIEYGDRTLTYRELAAEAVAQRARLGVDTGPGPLAIELEDRLEFALALHACLLSGRPALPIDLRLGARERAVRRERAGAVLDAWPPSGGEHAGAMPGSSLGMGDSVATVMHTSGTTSAPKPVELTFANWQAGALGSAVLLGLDPAERWLCVMPLAHVGGLSILLRSTIYATTVVLHQRFDVDAVRRELMDARRRITLVSLVPTMLARLLHAGLEHPPTLRWALLGGGPIPAALLERAEAAGVPVAPTYGMTEACSQIATFGHPLPGVDVITASGEILVRGPIVAPGALDEDGWLHTGDLGRFEDGRLVIVGRRSDTIVSGGENVAPAEVEAVLLEHPAVADAGVFARTDPEWGEAVIARVVLHDGASATAEALRDWCAARLARFKVPKQVQFAAELPRTASGKLLRRELH